MASGSGWSSTNNKLRTSKMSSAKQRRIQSAYRNFNSQPAQQRSLQSRKVYAQRQARGDFDIPF